MKKLGIFGGGFDPFHFGHEMLIKYLIMKGIVNHVWIVLGNEHAFGKQLAPLDARKRFILDILGREFVSNNCTIVEDDEKYTYDFLAKTHEARIDFDSYVVVGSDNAKNIHRWHAYDKLIKENKFIVFPRSFAEDGYFADPWYFKAPHIFVDEFPRMVASSTAIRRRFAAGDPCFELTNAWKYAKSLGLYGIPETQPDR